MTEIVTLTLNPALDLGTRVEQVLPGPKLRCAEPDAEPGGGGVNVSRAVAQLGGRSTAVVALAGPTGARLRALLEAQGLTLAALEAPGETRLSFSVTEDRSGRQFRFVMPGPIWGDADLERVSTVLCETAPDGAVVVYSGSQPPGAPPGFSARLGATLPGRRLVVDTSGPALAHLAAGSGTPPWLLRMDAEEAETLAGRALPGATDSAAFAEALRARGAAGRVVIARGGEGSVMAGPDGLWHVTAAGVDVVSAIGAGDSFVGGMVLALAQGMEPPEALRHGAAAASAAVVTDGTELCRREDFDALLPRCRLTRL